MAALSGSGVSIYVPERTGSGALLLTAPALSGFVTILTSVVREGTGSLVCKPVNMFGIGLTSIHESSDAVIRYESNRRLL